MTPGPVKLTESYQRAVMPKRITRGATMPLIWLALVAACWRFCAGTVLALVRLNMSSAGISVDRAEAERAVDAEVDR